ncbi:MAG TPA: neutral zinc metallopeptidase [Solirubrobacterales bacterium]|nr:neutral zinc metallopeptidase [Solirubrobacterales bacterium]
MEAGKRSADIEDRREAGGGFGGGGMPIPMGRLGGGGIGTIIVLAIVYFLFIKGGGGGGGFDVPDPTSSFPQVPQTGTGNASVPGSPNEEREVQFVDFVQGDAQDFWTQQFEAAGKPYQRAKLVVFGDQVSSGCGLASSATGPFYCPLDQRVYVDLGFFDELNQRFQAPGDFAQAYVLAHEIGHHLQQQLGIEQNVRQQSQQNPDDANELSVRLELQADCLAGVWARSTYDRGILESGDLQEGLTAAGAVGDDRIQEQAQGRIDPESFTHGTSDQRAHWLQTGFDSGRLEACDTFSGDV